jgi:cytidylate kinase
MIKIISIAGLPCCGKTTLCNSFASLHDGLSLDLEYLRTMFFEENIENNVFKFTHNEPIKENEDLRTYFLRCAIYDKIITFDEYIEWYKVIMEYMNRTILKILNDFKNVDYKDYLSKYSEIIKWIPFDKPDLIVLNHALLPLTDIWKDSILSIMLIGEESVLIERFMEREKLGSNKIKYGADILRHMNLYNVLNNGAKADIVYDTTNNFMDIRQIENILKGNIEYETRN